MSSVSEQVKAAIRECVGTPVQVLPATVEAIDKTKGTCTVAINGTLEVDGVRLRAVEGSEGFLIIPKLKSNVLVGRLANGDDMFIAMFSEVDKVVLKNDFASLKEIVDGLFDELVGSKILTPAGTGAFSPDNIAKFQELKAKADKILA